MTIDMLPDDVLLGIFDFYRSNHDYTRYTIWKWHLLVHVCRRWRQIVFASPHHLNLQLLCTDGTPVRKNLGIWPALPIVIDYRRFRRSIRPKGEDNVIAALQHPDRVCVVGLDVTRLQLEKMATVIQEPFPVLTCLNISSKGGNAMVLPGGFLGGYAPRLRSITLSGIPYPALPTLLLSTSDLVTLSLHNIPPTGYISPEAMVVGLAALPRLGIFFIEFQTATSHPDRVHPPPVTRTVLPALTYFQFQGDTEYLEDLVAQIDSPRLYQIHVHYLNQLVDFQVTQLAKFIDRSGGPESTPFKHAQVSFSSDWVTFDMYHDANYPGGDERRARTTISCVGIAWQVSQTAQMLSQFSATLSNVAHLKLEAEPEEDRQLGGTDDIEWLDLLHQFPTVQTLHVSLELAGNVALALEGITWEMVAEVSPSLDLIYLAGQLASSIENFVTVRQLSGRPVTVVDTKMEFDQRLESYI